MPISMAVAVATSAAAALCAVALQTKKTLSHYCNICKDAQALLHAASHRCVLAH